MLSETHGCMVRREKRALTLVNALRRCIIRSKKYLRFNFLAPVQSMGPGKYQRSRANLDSMSVFRVDVLPRLLHHERPLLL